MSDGNRDGLWDILVQHQEDITACREEVATMCDCLFEAGIMCPTVFRGRLQRRRQGFAKARLDSTLHIDEIVLAVGLHAGPGALLQLGATSKAIDSAVSNVWSIVRQLCPDYFVYLCGGSPDGRQTLDNAERFSLASGAWEPLPPMLERRAYGAAGAVGAKLYVCGGSTDGIRLNSTECFNPTSGSWEAMPPMSVPRECPSAGVVASRLYVCGGLDASGRALSTAESFHPDLGVWEALPPMSERRAWPAASAFVCGGRDGRRPLSSVDCYDPAAAVWTAMPPMSERRFGAAAAASQRNLYVCGGRSGAQALCSAECFDSEACTWGLISPMSVERFGTAAAAAAGQLYIFGGYGEGQPLSSAECFDFDAGAWTSLPAMTERREGAVAALCGNVLPDGRGPFRRARREWSPSMELKLRALRRHHFCRSASLSGSGRLWMVSTPPAHVERPHSL